MTSIDPAHQWLRSLHHDGSPRYVRQEGGVALLRLRADIEAPIHKAFVRAAPDGEQRLTPMRRAESHGVCQWWEAELPRAMPRDGYRFFVQTEAGNWWLSAAGLTRHTPTDATDFKLLSDTHLPHWVRDAVFYQIFPDRFADGDPSNNVRTGAYRYNGKDVIAKRWDELPSKASGPREFFGGDLQGIVQKLPYLEQLGVSALYLTPVFASPSSHKYDAATYEHVDPHFGGDEALVALRQALDARGMQLVLDVVPNHCGATHPWFMEALADPNAPTAEFFTFRRHPDEYESWLGVPTLPKLNYRSERLRQVMYADHDSIMRRWMRPPFRIDGWRVDVANMLARQGEIQLGHKIGRGIRRAVKAERADAYLLGENFYDGTPHLQGDELDACMNYRGFMYPLLQWLAGDFFRANSYLAESEPFPTDALVAQWRTYMAGLPWQIAIQQFNLLGSHDTARVATVLDGDTDRLLVARALLYTFPGVPCVYYGDEVGLEGGGDPDNRRPMPWDPARWNETVLEHERVLTRLRRSSAALRWGGFQLLHESAEALAFLRDAPEGRVVVVAQRHDTGLGSVEVRHGGIEDLTRFRELLSGAEVAVENGRLPLVGLAPTGAQVWVEQMWV